MSEEPTIIENKHRNFKKYVKNAGAIASMAAAFAGAAAPSAHAEKHPHRTKVEQTPQGPRNPANLPGHKIELSPETLSEIAQSTVEIGSRPAGADSAYQPGCTAVKVSIGERTFLMSAAHCFKDLTGNPYGTVTDPANPAAKAENFAANASLEYGVLDPSDRSLDERSQQPVAIIDKISISTTDKDVALLQAEAMAGSEITSPAIRQYDAIPAIPLNIAEKAPLAGTPVALFGEPQASGFEAIAGTGTYLGRVWYAYQAPGEAAPVARQIDLVGLDPDNPQIDNCNYGTSGSMALLPDGRLLGNLTMRSNSGYGPAKQVQWPDNIDFDNYWRPIWENQLNIKLDGFSTICGYTVMDAATPADLLAGFDVQSPGAAAPQAISLKP